MAQIRHTTFPLPHICASGEAVERQLNVFAGNNRLAVDMGNAAKRIYWIYAVGKEGRSNVLKFVK